MIKVLIGFLTAWICSICFAEPPKHIKQLVPKGWDILYFSEGDLNKDNQADIAMMIEKQKPDIVIKNDDGRILNNHPRMLLVLFKDKSNYKIVAKNTTLPVAEIESSCLMDPLGEVSDGVFIKNGTLTVDFSYFMSCGGWEWPRHFYTFRWQKNHFKLIGFDYQSFHRATGEEAASSYNFSTLKVKKTHGGNHFEGGKE